ncbi:MULTISPECIES: ferredoxin-thioredoxin reductase variable chain [unclassified Roseofilum]|uniref:ferredoxin-thioredoxin reductase variable chain n=1 Tax=unclassified Roseofilum TaxID=2620099 RepID=UPI000E815E4D|nr:MULTISPECIES: ferredoxin-thioredoxin reductase variable chain [unclassified Roseofilum]MBP0010380.1 ferredoxin-thioredoxin reductase variable chain [Roseofilum sp. Belize Diploria]MBP0034716.1 ferredoxin-thioredoxin reductase variable chain [Roseofilum sp. Belize BBD 4]HBQ97059.1 ferredoxin--nitrite reductase [Cyanobacteria bacterium UBA11691]
MSVKVGDRVRVKTPLVIYHHPQHRNEPFDLKGEEGEVINLASTYNWKGEEVSISANFPVVVQFPNIGKRFKAHLKEDELEVI